VTSTLCYVTLAASLEAQTAPRTSLADMSIEQLLNVTVTTVSKKEQNLRDTAAAISVLSNDDLRRSGATSLPEALRLVAGLNVAGVNSREWAVSARGFNGVFASKLLVLIDGRVVYTPLFAGVVWDLQQVMLEDVDRIEVIRGPGAAIWGANAVNGVINVVTRTARETQGGFVSAGGGDVLRATAGARYGGRISERTSYRVFGTFRAQDEYALASGAPADDGWNGTQTGVRLDRYSLDERSHLTWQADATDVNSEGHAAEAYNVNTIARWGRRSSARSSVEVQGFFDRVYNNEAARTRNTADTFDLTAQQTFGAGERHDVIWGLGYRFVRNRFYQTSPGVLIRNPGVDLQLFTGFVQDEFTLVPNRATLTFGVKLEHNDFTGLEIQPSARIAIKPSGEQTVWGAVSRAVRTPSAIQAKDINGIIVGPPFVGPGGGRYLPTITGNADPTSEILWAYETGWRFQPRPRISVDLAAFYNEYADLITSAGVTRFVPGTPLGTAELPFRNLVDATTTGVEATVTLAPSTASRVTLVYSLIAEDLRAPTGVTGAITVVPPRHQFLLRSGYDVTRKLSVDGQFRFVDSSTGVSAYVTADLHALFTPYERFEFALVAQDLLASGHLEQGPAPITVAAQTPRKFYVKLTGRF
jgi:iron complex outermembrane receptor protein